MKNQLKHDIYTFLRIAITGQESGPDIREIIKMIGIEEAFKRIDKYIDYINETDENK